MRPLLSSATLLLCAAAAGLPAALAACSGTGCAPPTPKPFCMWSQIWLVPYVPETDFYLVNHTVVRSCSDKLTPEQRRECLACAAKTTRMDCLHTTAHNWFDGADKMSCTWMAHNEKGERTRELSYTLGVNAPSMFSSTINTGKQIATGEDLICSVSREYTVYSGKEYNLAYFSANGNGEADELGPRDGDPLPGGQQPDASCVVEWPATKCNFTLHHTPKLQWAVSAREIWTTNRTIMARLDQGDEECLANKNMRCVRAPVPFRYGEKITEHPCGPGQGIPKLIKVGGRFPMGQPGYVLYPGGYARNYRQTGFMLDYVLRARWHMKSEKPIYLLVGPSEKLLNVCPPGATQVCNYKEAFAKWAYKNGISCYGTDCKGVITKPVTRSDVIMLAYPQFPAEEQAVMPASTPQQIVEFYMDAVEILPPKPK